MTAIVRVFCLSGIHVAPTVSGTNLTYDSVQLLRLPYLGRDSLSCDTSTVDSSEAASAPTGTNLAYVQVQSGKAVHYELTPQGQDLRTADTDSPVLTGNATLIFGAGWRIQVKEATTP